LFAHFASLELTNNKDLVKEFEVKSQNWTENNDFEEQIKEFAVLFGSKIFYINNTSDIITKPLKEKENTPYFKGFRNILSNQNNIYIFVVREAEKDRILVEMNQDFGK